MGLASLAVASTTVLSGASPAAAADGFSFGYETNSNGNGYIKVTNTTLGKYAGYGSWRADRDDFGPGDSLYAYDKLADGYGIKAILSTGRVASTVGRSAPAFDRAGGNLPEGRSYTMRVCVVKGDWSKCSNSVRVKA